jgi:hypothetical protein
MDCWTRLLTPRHTPLLSRSFRTRFSRGFEIAPKAHPRPTLTDSAAGYIEQSLVKRNSRYHQVGTYPCSCCISASSSLLAFESRRVSGRREPAAHGQNIWQTILRDGRPGPDLDRSASVRCHRLKSILVAQIITREHWDAAAKRRLLKEV